MKQLHIAIRAFKSEDIPTLTELTNQLGYKTTLDQMTSRMEALSKLDDHWTFVAMLDGKVVGYAGINQNYFWEQDGHYIRIQALVVDKEHRRMGVGEKLIVHTEQFAKSLKAKAMFLNCGNRAEREAAHKFYPKLGFEAKSTGYVKRLES